jgi:hypothetical protein
VYSLTKFLFGDLKEDESKTIIINTVSDNLNTDLHGLNSGNFINKGYANTLQKDSVKLN